jgi:Stage II sporulation protein
MRIAPAMLAAVVLAASVASFTAPAAVAGSSCTGWTSTTTAPDYIRVARVDLGRVDRVSFRSYVLHVMPAEWGDSLPWALQRAGAVASKQYGWYYTLAGHWRGGTLDGHCYDVKDTSADQRYRPSYSVSSRMLDAVDGTWTWTVWRSGAFVRTGYSYGSDVPCAYDAGTRLYERSARKCANLYGWGARHILERYYSGLVLSP